MRHFLHLASLLLWTSTGLHAAPPAEVFPGKGRGQYDYAKRFAAAVRAAGIADFRFHDLRHSTGTYLAAKGVRLRTIMEILGHSTIAVTMNTYAHVMPLMQREAADKMDALLRRQSSS